MKNDNLIETTPLTEIERAILLHTSGELTSEEEAELALVLLADRNAAAYAHFIQDDLLAATNAPRNFAETALTRAPQDFAMRAIEQVHGNKKIPSPRSRKPIYRLLAAAALVMLSASVFWFQATPPRQVDVAMTSTQTETRLTTQLSQRTNSLESELFRDRTRSSRNRYHNSSLSL